MLDATWSYEPCVCSIIGLSDVRDIRVSRVIERGETYYHAVCTSITDTDLDRLIERVHVAWNREKTFAEEWNEYMTQANYAAGYAYACGYFD